MDSMNRIALVAVVLVGGLVGQNAQASYSTMSTTDLLNKLSNMATTQASRASESANYATQAESLFASATTTSARQSALTKVDAWLITVSDYEVKANAAVNDAGIICLILYQRGNLSAYNSAMNKRKSIVTSRGIIADARYRLSNVKNKLVSSLPK